MRSREPSDGSLIVGSATDAGRSGKNNEDSYAVFDAEWQDDVRLATVKVAVVADGIGGANAGELASRIAVEKIASVMQRRTIIPVPERLEQAVMAANQDIYDAALSSPSARGMGTTIVIAAIVNNTLYMVHAGDSRAYLVRNGKVNRLTLDHTWAQEAIDAEYLTPEAARVHPNRNVIKRFLGIEETVTVDHKMIDIARVEPGAGSFGQWPMVDRMVLQPGDTVLLCSDGLTDELSDPELQATMGNHKPEKVAQQLVAKANAKGGRDNITVTLLRLPGGTAGPAPLPHRWLLAGVAVIAAILAIGGGALALGRWSFDPEGTPTGLPVAIGPTLTIDAAMSATIVARPSSGTLAPTPTTTENTTLPPTSTPVPGATSTPTARPTRLRTGTPTIQSPRPTRGSTAGVLSVELVEPINGDSGSDPRPFSWRMNGSLSSNQAFQLVFWRPGQDPLTEGIPVAASTALSVQINVPDLVDNGTLQPGEYQWGLLLIEMNPSRPPRYLGGGWMYHIKQRVAPEPTNTPPPPTDSPPPPPPPRSAPVLFFHRSYWLYALTGGDRTTYMTSADNSVLKWMDIAPRGHR